MVKHFVHRRLVRHIDTKRIESAIAAAELRTSAPIHVSLAPHFWGELRKTAERAFDRLGLTATPERNGILFFVAPTRREFVVLGDVGIHQQVGQEFWDHVAAAVSSRIKQGDLTDGLVHGIETVADELERRFPRAAR
ncbi:MAG TPA: TPM domain-containing protein [Candidatus Eremiobacteraceae bacterium]|nr:TPM domain-containing protein [Candidatus Eremiobacteraceae bacterium]